MTTHDEFLLIWQKEDGTPLVGMKDGDHYLLCGAPYGDSIVMAEDVERIEHIASRLSPSTAEGVLRSARPYVEVVARGEGTMPEIVCAEATLNAIDAALAKKSGEGVG